MSEMLLLGAGASVEAGVPGAYAMTQAMLDHFRRAATMSLSDDDRKSGHILSFVVGGLLFEAGKNNQDPLKLGVNIEDLFNAVQLLAERNSLEAAPFVGSWHAMVDEFDKASPSSSNTHRLNDLVYKSVVREFKDAFRELPQGHDRDQIDRNLASYVKRAIESASKGRSFSGSSESIGKAVESYLKQAVAKWSQRLQSASPSSSHSLDREVKELIDQRFAKPGNGEVFHQLNESMIEILKDLVWIEDPAKVAYLQPILNLLGRQNRLVVVTLNYDNGIELMAESRGVRCDSGLDSWSAAGDFDFSGDGLSLLKLHGSIDWTWAKGVRTQERLMPHSEISKIEASEVKRSFLHPAVIFGQRNKLTAEGPFLDLLRAFRDDLARSEILTVVGYSFRDPHINVYISQWLNADRGHRIRIACGPGFEAEATDYMSRLKLLRTHSPGQVTILPKYAGEALNELYGSMAGDSATETS